jgi:hypothetical protein
MARRVAGRLVAKRGLAPLHHRGFRLLAAGQLASNVGDSCYAVALPWYVLAEHGGALLLGTVAAPFFPIAAVTVAIPLLAGLSQRTWRDFGMTGGREASAASGTRPVSAAADVLGGAS